MGPHGSMLVPILFLIFISDLEKRGHSEITKFIDDTKLFWVVKYCQIGY